MFCILFTYLSHTLKSRILCVGKNTSARSQASESKHLCKCFAHSFSHSSSYSHFTLSSRKSFESPTEEPISNPYESSGSSTLAPEPTPQPKQESTVKKKGKQQAQVGEQQPSQKDPEANKMAPPVQPPAPSNETKREKTRTKKQSQRNKPTVVEHLSPANSVTGAEAEAADSMLWETAAFDHSSDSASGNDWLVAQPASSSRNHRTTVNQMDSFTSGSDWRTTGPSGSTGSSKRKMAIPVSKHDIGKIIGQGGAVVSALRLTSGIQIDIESARADDVQERMVYLKGNSDMVQKTYQTILDLLSGAVTGNEVIAKSKLNRTGLSSTTATSSIPSVLSTSTVTSRSNTGVVSSRKNAPSSSGKLTAQIQELTPQPQPLMSAKVTNPNLVAKASVSNNSNVSRITGATPLASWGAVKTTQRSNFASVAAAGVVSPSLPQSQQSTKNRNKLSNANQQQQQQQPSPVSLLSVTIAALSECSKIPPPSIFSTAPVSNLLDDEQSFPPLSTTTTSVTTSTVSSKLTDSVPAAPPLQRKMSLPTPQSESGVSVSVSVAPSSPTLVTTISVPSEKSRKHSESTAPGDSPATSQLQKPHPVSRTQVPTTTSRTFALAPGSERSANRHAGSGTTASATPLSMITHLAPTSRRLNSATTSSSYGNVGVESLFPTRPSNVSTTSGSLNTLSQPSMDSFFPSAQQSVLQPSVSTTTSSVMNQFDVTGGPMWSHFNPANENSSTSTYSSNYDYLSGRGTSGNATANLLQNLGIRNFESLLNAAAMMDESVFSSNYQSGYRASQQNQFGVGGGVVCKPNGSITPNTISTGVPFMPPGGFSTPRGVATSRDYALYNGGTSATPMPSGNNTNNPSNAFLSSRLNHPVNSVQQMAKSQQALLSHQQQHQQTFDLGMPSSSSTQLPLDQNLYLAAGSGGHVAASNTSFTGNTGNLPGSSNYGYPQVGRAYPSIPQRQEPQLTAPHQPAPIGAERRRPQQPTVSQGMCNPVTTSTEMVGHQSQGVMNPATALATNQALMALLLQQHQQQQQQQHSQHQVLQDPTGSVSWSSQPIHQSTFWSQSLCKPVLTTYNLLFPNSFD